MKITTNHQPRPVLYWYDLTGAERAELDYLDDEDKQADARLFRYRGHVYDLGEFQAIRTRSQQARSLHHWAYTAEDDSPLTSWHGIQTDSAFSALVIHLAADGETVIVGNMTC